MQPLSSEIDIVHRRIKRFGSGRSICKDTSRGRQMQPQGSHNPNQKLLYSFVLVQSRTCCFLLCRFGGCLNTCRSTCAFLLRAFSLTQSATVRRKRAVKHVPEEDWHFQKQRSQYLTTVQYRQIGLIESML